MALKSAGYKIEIEFIAPLLGTQPTRDVATEYIAEKNGFELTEQEIEMLPDALERGTTVFHKDKDGNPVLMNYQIKGFLKNAAKNFNGQLKAANGKPLRNARHKASQFVFIFPRVLTLDVPEGEEIDYIERPLRAQTAQGDRVALARSEMLPAGTKVSFQLEVFGKEITQEIIADWLDYGYYQGIGGWRGASYGSFTYKLTAED